jgi:hypothetical protein
VYRLLFAVIGAAAITIGMLLGMNEIAKKFRERDPTRYFSVTDFIPAEGIRKPRLAPTPEAQPERPSAVDAPPAPKVSLSRPTVDEAALLEAAEKAASLDRPPSIDGARPAD